MNNTNVYIDIINIFPLSIQHILHRIPIDHAYRHTDLKLMDRLWMQTR